MNRSDIPAALRVSRAADVARIPAAVLKSMTPGDVAPRLLAADEFRRRAGQRHQLPETARMYAGLASEILTTGDSKRAAALMKSAGVPFAGHDPMSGTHSHSHPAFGSQGGDQEHEHEHSHSGDADHRHYADHARMSAGKSAGPLSGMLRKAAPPAPAPARGRRSWAAWAVQEGDGPPVRVAVPILDALASDSAAVIARAAGRGELTALAREIDAVEKARVASAADLPGKAAQYEQLAAQTPDPATAAAYREMARKARGELAHVGDHLSKAAAYEQQAAVVIDPAAREAYLQLARCEREKAGAA